MHMCTSQQESRTSVVPHHSQILNAYNGPGLLYNDPRSKESFANTETNNVLVLNTFQRQFPTSVLSDSGTVER